MWMFGYRYKANVRDSHWRGAGGCEGNKEETIKVETETSDNHFYNIMIYDSRPHKFYS